MAYVMLGDLPSAEDVVQEAFYGLYRRWERLADTAGATYYVRTSVLNGCRSALWRLPDRQREVLILRFYAELPDEQIARVIGIRPGTVRSTAFRALDTLGRTLKETS